MHGKFSPRQYAASAVKLKRSNPETFHRSYILSDTSAAAMRGRQPPSILPDHEV